MEEKIPQISGDHISLEHSFPKALDRIGFLAAGIVHNLYGPLTGIMGTIELMKLKYPELSEDLERLDRLSLRLKNDIAVIMDKVRGEGAGDVVTLNLADLVENELLFHKGDPRLKHKIELNFEHPASLPDFRAPYRDFSISIDHILTNAIEAMEDMEKQELQVTIEQQGELLLLSFEDTGCGMDKETMSRALEPFFTTKKPLSSGKNPEVRARGIGLTHAAMLLEGLGCKLELQSNPGSGTTVTVSIPYKTIHDSCPERDVPDPSSD